MAKKKNILTNWGETHEVGLMWIDHPDEPLECDFCDEIKPLAHINHLCNNVICICQECLQIFANDFNSEEMEKKNSEDWKKDPKYAHIEILDPDGWDRKNFEESWNEEITEEEFQNRIAISTCILHFEGEEMETCVMCKEELNIPKSLHIDFRKYYVEGAGQLCKTCYDKTYNG